LYRLLIFLNTLYLDNATHQHRPVNAEARQALDVIWAPKRTLAAAAPAATAEAKGCEYCKV
jgi:hypothetical protein